MNASIIISLEDYERCKMIEQQLEEIRKGAVVITTSHTSHMIVYNETEAIKELRLANERLWEQLHPKRR